MQLRPEFSSRPAGDLGELEADGFGVAPVSLRDGRVSLFGGVGRHGAIAGRTMVVARDGNEEEPLVACGVVQMLEGEGGAVRS